MRLNNRSELFTLVEPGKLLQLSYIRRASPESTLEALSQLSGTLDKSR